MLQIDSTSTDVCHREDSELWRLSSARWICLAGPHGVFSPPRSPQLWPGTGPARWNGSRSRVQGTISPVAEDGPGHVGHPRGRRVSTVHDEAAQDAMPIWVVDAAVVEAKRRRGLASPRRRIITGG
ncbi:uncharacterized protein UV8b_01832 [Ustilaginoidea virens]|uniref:Uncharacterized protein n=1 Tax=Ustilaginoidea virens TaxID=1159556 RepID=A0A8E5HLD9_USTVR|nr:uncharacterized protein UV8b_01832 [Ustilaginoidea virens]QUC17591.1 hypothetical protein UV8b_01832 [Ustilaginoidea virens]